MLLFKNIRNVCNTKHNLIFVWKLVKIASENDFCLCIIMIFSDFWKFMFYMAVKQHS